MFQPIRETLSDSEMETGLLIAGRYAVADGPRVFPALEEEHDG
jgi:hypothetical protein